METTLIILKPDAVQRGLMGRIISRFEDKGLQIVGAKFMQISNELASTHYSDHQGKPFYNGLVGFMTSSPVLVMAIRGKGGFDKVIQMIDDMKAQMKVDQQDVRKLFTQANLGG